MNILAEKGHEVTVVSPFSKNAILKNYEEIYLDGLLNKSWGKFWSEATGWFQFEIPV